MTGSLLAFFKRIPNEEALELAPTAGWIMLFLAVMAGLILVINREGWRRAFLRAEDPRTMGVFRIVFAFCAMCNINGLWELFEYLFTDEGIFISDVARQVYAREQFRGFGNGLAGDEYGFFGWAGVWQFLKGPKYSLLFFWDSPRAWWIHWAAFQLSVTMLMLGMWTRYTKWISAFLFHSIILRNNIFWEGTENVYRCFFFYLCLSKCGRAYSIDNWWRCRKLRKKGLLSVRGGPGDGAGIAPSEDHPKGLEAIYRRIPAWPRILIILQVAAIYCYTGVVKNGSVWWRGDAMYYALNLDHFYRLPPQQLSAVLGTTLFKLNTWITHAWESLFPVVVLGMFVRFGMRERLPKWSKTTHRIHTAAWIAFGLGCLVLCEYLWPVHFARSGKPVTNFAPWKAGWWTLQKAQWVFGIGWILGMLVIGFGWRRLRNRPIKLTLKGHEFTIDLDWFLKWFLGRRVWVFIGLVFQTHAFVLMNIGWFQPGTSSGFLAFVSGTEMALLGVVFGKAFARIPGVGSLIPQWVKDGKGPTPAEDPTLPHLHHDGVRLPMSTMVIGLAIAASGVLLQYKDLLAYGWTLIGLFAFLAGSMWREAKAKPKPCVVLSNPYEGAPERVPYGTITEPWAYGPRGRLLAACLAIYQIVGVACWLLPDKDSFKWRTHTHEPFKWWLQHTQTTQGWKMFAPNPPRANRFLKVLVTDEDGETWDMRNDIYAEESRPLPWIWYTRQRKINRRIGGSEGGHGSWYQKWHGRYHCRQWQKTHNGEVPRKVELINITYTIPTPEYVFKNGPYDPWERLEKTGKEKLIYTARCRTEVGAQLVNEIRARHGIEPAEIEIRRWSALRGREAAWERYLKNEAKKAEEKKNGKSEDKDDSKAKKDDKKSAKSKKDGKKK